MTSLSIQETCRSYWRFKSGLSRNKEENPLGTTNSMCTFEYSVKQMIIWQVLISKILNICSFNKGSGTVLTGRWCLCPGPHSSHPVAGRKDQSIESPPLQWMDRGHSTHQPKPGGTRGCTDTASEKEKSSEEEDKDKRKTYFKRCIKKDEVGSNQLHLYELINLRG